MIRRLRRTEISTANGQTSSARPTAPVKVHAQRDGGSRSAGGEGAAKAARHARRADAHLVACGPRTTGASPPVSSQSASMITANINGSGRRLHEVPAEPALEGATSEDPVRSCPRHDDRRR
jgi:hypothetical protein